METQARDVSAKASVVTDLGATFEQAGATFVVGYQGTTFEQLKTLRRKLRPVGAKMSVVKNSLAYRAVQGGVHQGLGDLFVGPTAVIWSKTDPVAPAKLITEFAKESEHFKVKGGVVDGSVIKPAEIESLAKLPSREELLAKLLSLINAPATRLLQTINAPAQNVVGVLSAWKGEIEKRG